MSRGTLALLLGGGLLALLAACGDARPPAARQFAVGVTTRELVDDSRSTPANGDVPASPSRTLPTDIWYPAIPGPAGAGVDANGAMRDAPLDPAGAPYPLVFFVHGSMSFRDQSTFLTTALARAGYVVAAADFPLTAASTPGGPSDLHFDLQVGDVAFLADRLAAASRDATDLLARAIDPAGGYAVSGHSTGGTVALLAAYAPDMHDPRVRAAIALAPCACFLDPPFFRTRSVPLLVMAGTDDLLVPYSDNGRRAYDLAPPPKVFALLVGGTHLFFSDFDIPDNLFPLEPTTSDSDIAVTVRRYGTGQPCNSIPAPGTDPLTTIDAQHARTTALVTAFADRVFRRDTRTLAGLEAAHDPLLVISSQ